MSVEEVTSKVADIELNQDAPAAVESKTVSVKHPLNTEWTLWYTKPKIDNNEDWSSLLRPITKISSVEEFWGFYSCIPRASTLPQRSDYHLFRNDIRPEWEDPANSKGGKWSVFISDSKKKILDEIWLKLMLSSIGEILEDSNELSSEINGVVFNCKKKSCRFGVWTKNYQNKDVLLKIGENLKKIIETKINLENLTTESNEDAKEEGKEEEGNDETTTTTNEDQSYNGENIVLEFSKHNEARDVPPMYTL